MAFPSHAQSTGFADTARQFIVPGCYIDRSKVSLGSAFVIEFVTDLAFIFLAFGVGLDPRQRVVFGPTLGPILVGVTLAVCIVSTGIMRAGYTGFCMEFPVPVQ